MASHTDVVDRRLHAPRMTLVPSTSSRPSAPSPRRQLRVSERCLVRFNGVAGLTEQRVTRQTGDEEAVESLGEVSEPLS